MKKIHHLLISTSLTLLAATTLAQNATWSGSAGDNDWNNALNWDIGVPAEGTNAVIAAGQTVNYNAPMVATAIGSLMANSPLNVNAAGFVVGASGNAAAVFGGSTSALLSINDGGVLSVPNGGLVASTNGAVSLAAGGSLTTSGLLSLGSSGNVGFLTNVGGTLSVGGLRVNPNNASTSARAVILGGSNYLGNVSIWRSGSGSAAFSALGTEGLIISNGLVNIASLTVGVAGANSSLTMQVAGGTVTNTGSFIVGQVTGANSRPARFLQQGGLVVSTGADGIRVGVSNSTQVIQFSVLGGTNIAEKFVLGDGSNGVAALTVSFTNAARVYVGSGGIVSNNVNTLNVVLNSGSFLGANANWTGTVPMLLNGGAFDCGDLSGIAHDIALNGVLRGSAVLTKTGGGKLTLNAANTFTGNTLVNQGTLALGATGAFASSPQIILAAGATFDVSAVSGYTLGASRTLTGMGNVIGDVAAASTSLINPGSPYGTLTLGGALTMTGGAILHLDLPTTPGPGNDLLVVNGDLNLSGLNTLEIVGGGSPGSVHTVIQYGGNFNGSTANFALSGTTATLSNNPTTKTLALVIESAIRNPTNVVWVGSASVNDWDTVNHTNWLNVGTGLLDYFVTGDSVLFNDVGAAHPNVNLVANLTPSTLTVGASGSYTFGGSGAIVGTGGLTKTNSGTLTITSTNRYTGVTTIGGGVLEAASLTIGGVSSAIGAATIDPNNIVFDGGTLRYPGASVTTDRGATVLAGGGGVDVADASAALTVSGTLTGAGALTKAGAGSLVLSGANNYAGGTVINQGVLQVSSATGAGAGSITNNSATLRVNGATTVDNLTEWTGNCTLELSGVGSGNVALRGAWTGSGTVLANFLTQNTSQTLSLGGEGAGGGNMWNFSGTLDFGTNRGYCRLNNNSSINFGSSNATFHLGSGDLLFCQRNGGTTTYLGALSGGPNTRLSGARNDVSGNTTYVIGGKNLDTLFEGVITNGQSGTSVRPAVIVKTGTGKLTLTGASTYTGTTTIEAGTLRVDGSLANTSVTVVGGTLSGVGALAGPVDVQAGAVLSPGNDAIGQLTINNWLNLQYGCSNVFRLSKAQGISDSVAGLAGVNFGGTLVVTNLTGDLVAGDIFYLFPGAGSYGGVFEAFDLPALPSGLVWQTSSLLADGSIRVVTPSGPAFSGITIIDGNVTLNATNGTPYGQFILFGSTNLALPLNAWIPMATNTFDAIGDINPPLILPLDPTALQQFYLLQQ